MRLARLRNIAETRRSRCSPTTTTTTGPRCGGRGADGVARLLDPADPEAAHARRLLAARYPQYRAAPPAGDRDAIDVTRWSGWAARAA